MSQSDMTKFMGDDGGDFFGAHLAELVFVQKTTGDENPTVRCCQPVYDINFINVDRDAWQVQCTREPGGKRPDGAVLKRSRLTVERFACPPCGEPIERKSGCYGQ